MTMVRQDEMPARRRYRHERLAVLALLALGSNLGCGRDMLRVPAGHVTTSMMGASPPSLAATRRAQPGPAPVALKADYGSSIDELFPTTYMNPASYGSQLASKPARKPAETGPASGGDLLAACDDARIPPPARRRPMSPLRLVDPDDPFRIAHIPPPRVARQHTDAPAGSRPGAITLAEASSTTRIALPKPPKARVRTQSSTLVDASVESGIALPIDPSRRTAKAKVHRADTPDRQADTAFETAKIAPPIPVLGRSEQSTDSLDSACVATRIPPPAPADSRRPARMSAEELPGLPPRQLDASVFETSKEPADAPPPPAEAPGNDRDEPSDLSAAFEEARIAPPIPVRGPQPQAGSN